MGYDQPMTQRHNAAFPAPFGVYCWQRWEGPPGRRLPPVFPQRCAVASVHVGAAGHCFLGLNGIFHANTLKPSGAFMPYQRWCLKPLCLRKSPFCKICTQSSIWTAHNVSARVHTSFHLPGPIILCNSETQNVFWTAASIFPLSWGTIPQIRSWGAGQIGCGARISTRSGVAAWHPPHWKSTVLDLWHCADPSQSWAAHVLHLFPSSLQQSPHSSKSSMDGQHWLIHTFLCWKAFFSSLLAIVWWFWPITLRLLSNELTSRQIYLFVKIN